MICPRCRSDEIRELGVDHQGYTVYICDSCKHVFQTVQYCEDVDSGNLFVIVEGKDRRLGAG